MNDDLLMLENYITTYCIRHCEEEGERTDACSEH